LMHNTTINAWLKIQQIILQFNCEAAATYIGRGGEREKYYFSSCESLEGIGQKYLLLNK
jgi:hypothetical protein